MVVVSYNTREHLRACLESVVREAPGEIIVADNGSSDGSNEMVRADFPAVRLIVDHTNPGYGGAANRAIATSAAPYALLLNSDVILPAGSIAAMARYMCEHERVGMLGPRLVNPDGTLQPSCHGFPSVGFLVVEYSALRAVTRIVSPLRARYFVDWPHDRARAVPWVCGAVLLLRREAFDPIGGFDQSFHMYFEEVDLAYRMRMTGWETHFAPVASVTHTGGASTIQSWDAMRTQHFRSLMRFTALHSRTGSAATTALVFKGMLLGKLALDRTRQAVTRDPPHRADLAGRVAHWRSLLREPFLRQALGRDG